MEFSNIKWIASLWKVSKALMFIVCLLIAIGALFYAIRTMYYDNRSDRTDCETRVAALAIDNQKLSEQIQTLNTKVQTVQELYFEKKRVDDSTQIAKLNVLTDELNRSTKQQEKVNLAQSKNIQTRSQIIKENDVTRKKNEQNIKALQNEIQQ